MTRTLARSLLVVVASLAAWVVLSVSAGAAPDTPAVTGTAVATPSGACANGSGSVTFSITATITNNVLSLSDPGGTTSGPILANGTAQLSGSTESYSVVSQSGDGRMLTMTEMNGGCLYDTVATFPAGFPLLATTPVTPPPVQKPPTPKTPAKPVTSGPAGTGNGMGWLWGLLVGGGILAVGGGVVLNGRKPKEVAVEQDDDIRQAAASWYGVNEPTTPDAIAERDWRPLLVREQQIQDEILADFSQLLAQVAQGAAEYNQAFDTYRTTYSRVLSGSTELQGLLQTWAESQTTLEKADLAFAILTLLVSGVSLGIKGVRLIRGIGAATEAVGEGARVVEAGATAVRAGEGTSGMANANLKVAQALAQEAGLNLSQVMAKHGGSLELAVKEIAEVVFARRGWHYLSEFPSVMAGGPVNVSEVVSRLVTNTRTALAAAARRGALTSEAFAGTRAGGVTGPSLASIKRDIEILQEVAAKEPKFLESLRTAVVDMYEPSLHIGETGAAAMTEGWMSELSFARAEGNLARVAQLEGMIAKAKQAADVQGQITAKLLGAGDYELLTKVIEAGGDMAKLRELLGPAQAITMTEIFGKAGLSVGATTQTTMNLFVNGSTTQIYDVADFAKSFGVVGRYESSSNVGTFMAGELWHLVTSPFKTVGEHFYTNEALDAQQRFMESFGGDLQTMATAVQQGTNAIGHISRAIRNARLDDPHTRLGGRGANDLRGALEEMHRALQRGSEGFRAQHRPEYEERRAHVEQKLATIDRVLGELKALAVKLPQLEQWLHQLQVNPDGSLRPITEGIDPQTLMRMSSAFFYLNGVLGTVATGGGTQPPPETKRPCDAERTRWGNLHRQLGVLDTVVIHAKEGVDEAVAAEKTAARELSDLRSGLRSRTGADLVALQQRIGQAEAQEAEAVANIIAARQDLAEEQAKHAQVAAEEEEARHALEACEKASGGG